MNNTSISVITVAYNALRTIGATIDSVAGQTHPCIEHIVVDGGSTDGSRELLRSRGSCLAKWISEPDKGIYDAMNKGLRLATGDVVGFLNADDLFASVTSVARMAREFLDPSVEACYGDLVYVDDEDINRVIRYWQAGEFHLGAFGKGWVPPHPTFYAKRELYDRLGAFDIKYRLAADFDLMLRFLETNRVSCSYIREVLVRMRIGGATNSSLRNILRQNMEIVTSSRLHGVPMNLAGFVARKLIARGKQFLTAERQHGS